MSETVAREGCIFCRIASGEVPSKEAYSSELVYAFHDLNPVAPVHVLVVPREHIADAASLEPDHADTLAEMALAARSVAEAEGIVAGDGDGEGGGGYRLIFNVGPDSGSEVSHLHMHVVGGRVLGWPPG